jgi:hypothetical protein
LPGIHVEAVIVRSDRYFLETGNAGDLMSA